MNDYSPDQVLNEFWRWWKVWLTTVAVIALLIVGGWRAGWWFAGQNANREAHIIRQGYSNQQTLREQITAQIANVNTITVQIAQAAGNTAEVAALKAQRIAVVNIACGDAVQVTGDPLARSQRTWIKKNCQAGVIRPGSPYTQQRTSQ